MQNPYIALLRTAWAYARHERRQYIFVYFLFIMANVVTALRPLLFGWFIGKLQQTSTDILQVVWLYVGGYFSLELLEWAFHGPARVMERRLAFNLSRNFLNELFHQTLHLPVGWHKDHHSGATINRIRKAYDALKTFFQDGFIYLQALSKFVFSFGAMLYFSPAFGLVGVALGALTIYVILRFDKPFIKALDEANEREHVVSSTLFDSLSNIITVITLRLEERIQQALDSKVVLVFVPFMRHVKINEWKWFAASMLVGLIYIVLAMGYVYQHYVPGQVFLIGGLVTLLGYVNQFTSVFNDIAWQYTQIVQFNTDVQTARGIGEAYARHERPEHETLPDRWQIIDITGLNFSHGRASGSSHKVSNLIDLQIQLGRGKRVAFIGESGSGKSTLLTLLRGLYLPEPGLFVQVDGQSIPDLNAVANTVTLFPQEPEIFENTIAYNITLGLPFSDEEVNEVCRVAYFSEVVKQLPKGLETNIQEKGVNLSGGQRQRLALARGVLAARSSDIVLLDEPTSSIDPKTELAIYRGLLKEFADKAIVSTLHRLHLLPLFDYIYIMQDGKIIDKGSFSDLRQHSSIFQEMWAHQKEVMEQTEG
ncbi:ATP-binding cassette domain-containing protein [Spirosoma sp. HMF4905]|uniref:ATP-binding cassette domain-containing protein n=1 Tax=Spirosoma arboris TaxID=2682092 RepID=A0A7K1SEX9_9BACT|nr:ABC transporter ATP-binding protein [Spirosoma arboris]MVM32370.1 ATP-binding cassette domain-containing protein [Spirosoma arboris]